MSLRTPTSPRDALGIASLSPTYWLSPRKARLGLSEGRYHQVRRMFAAVGNHVETLHRVSVGGLVLGDLPVGEWRALDADETARIFV